MPKGVVFQYEPSSHNRKFAPGLGTITIPIRFEFKAEGFAELAGKLEAVLDLKSLAAFLEQVVIRSLVVNIRRRFLDKLETSLQVHTLIEDDREVKVSPRRRFKDVDLKKRLQRTLEQLNEAQLEHNDDTAADLREKASNLTERLHARLNIDPGGREQMSPHRLSVLGGNRFRRQLVVLLHLITDAHFVTGREENGGVMVGIGPFALLDQLETPSATMALTGHGTSSKYKSFWRHVEFGTGIYRSASKDRINLSTNPRSHWWYGRRSHRNLQVLGVAPMNFLTDNDGRMYGEDADALHSMFNRALTDLLNA